MKKLAERLFLFFIFLFLSTALSCCSKFFKKDRYIVATSPNNPPLVMIDEEKEIVGFEIDVIEQIAISSDMNIKIIPVLKGNLLHGLIDETYDIAISSITSSNGARSFENIDINYSNPYMEIGEVFVLSEDFKDYKGLKDLVNKTVGLRKATESKQILIKEGHINIKEYTNIENTFEDMALGKIDAICVDLPTAAQFVHLNDEYKRIFRIHPDPITVKEYVIAVKKGSNSLLNRINSGIEKMKKDGSLDMLINKWFFLK